jgi:hypothetical protein
MAPQVEVSRRLSAALQRWRPSWTDLASVAVLLSLVLATWVPRLRGPIDLRYDAGYYFMLGTAIAKNKGYRLLSEPGEVLADQYPPGLPAIVALFQRLLGTSDPWVVGEALRRFSCGCCMAIALISYLLARQFFGMRWALAVALIASLNLYTWWLGDYLFAEVPFALLSLLFILVSIVTDRKQTNAAAVTVIQAVLVTAAYLVRTAGVALIAAWIGEAAFRRQWRATIVRAVIGATPVLVWQAYVHSVENSYEYQHPAYAYQRADYQFHNVSYAKNLALLDAFAPEQGKVTPAYVAKRFARNLIAMPETFGECVTSPLNYWKWQASWLHKKAKIANLALAARPALVALGLLVAAGLGVLAWRRQWLLLAYVAASAGLACGTSWRWQFPRYLAPATAVLAIAIIALIRGAIATLRPAGVAARIAQSAFVALICAILAQQAFTVYLTYRIRRNEVNYRAADGTRRQYHLFFFDHSWESFDDALDWLNAHAGQKDVIASTTPEWVWLRTGRKSIFPPFDATPDREQADLDSVPVRYIVVDSFPVLDVMARYVRPLVEKTNSDWRPVYIAPNNTVYERVSWPP